MVPPFRNYVESELPGETVGRDGCRQRRLALQERVNGRRTATTFGNSPDNQALTADGVSTGKDRCAFAHLLHLPGARYLQSCSWRRHFRPIEAQCVQFRADKSSGNEDVTGRQGSGLLGGIVTHHNRFQRASPHELEGFGAEDAFAPLFVCAGYLVQASHRWPRLIGGAVVRWHVHDFDLRHRLGTLTVGGAEAVSTGVAATEDDDIGPLYVDS